jgi:NTF2-related export protein 1/2
MTMLMLIYSAAHNFTQAFYAALNDSTQRTTLSTYYIQPTPLSPVTADISLNGNIIPTPNDLQTLFETELPGAHYEVQSYDCHVINPNYNVGVPDNELGPDSSGMKMSILVLVSGYVKYFKEGKERGAEMRGFTENFVLVPNYASRTTAKKSQKWLIQSQNFRLIV